MANFYSTLAQTLSEYQEIADQMIEDLQNRGFVTQEAYHADNTPLDISIPVSAWTASGSNFYADVNCSKASSSAYCRLDISLRNPSTMTAANLKKAQKGKHNLEGYLFPSTYTIPATSDGDFIISTMLSAYQKVFTDADRAKAKKLGYSENEIIIIASIIEKEAAVELQMDSTVQYVLSLSSDRKKDLSIDDTKVDSKYNTYKYTGLPPGPICNPGRASIEAALNPAKTKYMYFILSDRLDDTMVFSTTYKQFLKDKEAYYKARDKAESKNN